MTDSRFSDAREPSRTTGTFFSLTPDRVLEAVERAGHRTTGLCYALNSLENRVYEVELEDRRRLVGKFYRPGRWGRETILDEHRMLAALDEAEIPVCTPIAIGDGGTLQETQEGILFALFPRTGGRSPEELSLDEYQQLGRLLARIHNVGASLRLASRPRISPQTYGRECLEVILKAASLSPGAEQRYVDAVERLIAIGEERFAGVETFPVHGDCHRGNLLRGSAGWFFLDFDDMAHAPAAQDLWLLLPARPGDCPQELEAIERGYEAFRELPVGWVRLVEVLRGLRYVRYAAWVATRWDDPAFKRAFPHWGNDNYWEEQISDVYDQVRLLEADRIGS
jgi:Ser/Thr protein kinase RdoA (MazF antagonist)